jgi:hypothetical protein
VGDWLHGYPDGFGVLQRVNVSSGSGSSSAGKASECLSSMRIVGQWRRGALLSRLKDAVVDVGVCVFATALDVDSASPVEAGRSLAEEDLRSSECVLVGGSELVVRCWYGNPDTYSFVIQSSH